MSDPGPEETDRELARLERRALRRTWARVALRLALAGGALGLVFVGCEALRPGVGYLVAGLLVWVELARAAPAPRTPEAREGDE